MPHTIRRLVLAVAVTSFGLFSGTAQADDKHEGYYYPKIETTESYGPRARVLPEANRALRLSFVTEFTNAQMSRAFAPQYAFVAKGAQSEKLIIVALDDEVFATLYKARGVLAQMSAFARSTPLFKQYGLEDQFTFFDMLKLMGFTQLTITDGRTWAHRVEIE